MKQLGAFRFLILMSIVASMMLAESCVHEPFNPVPPDPGTPQVSDQCDPDTAYFQKDVMPIIQANCVTGCHDEATANNGVVLESYERIMATADVRPGNPSGSDLYEVLIETDPEKRMPFGGAPLASKDIEAIRKWIAQGALNNDCTSDSADTTSNCGGPNMSYQNDVFPVFQSKGCIGCHSSGSVVLNTHAGAAEVANDGRLVGAITHADGYQAMPKGGEKMDSCSIAIIVDWVEQGAKDN